MVLYLVCLLGPCLEPPEAWGLHMRKLIPADQPIHPENANVQEIWDTMKRPNLRIIGIEEGEETHLKGAENIFNKIIEEHFPNLEKSMPMKV